jgi:hypothetical protein
VPDSKRWTGQSACVVALLVAGCSAAPKAPQNWDTSAREIRPPEGMALVYVVRPSRLGKALEMPVICDGDVVGVTGGKRYLYTILEPGPHSFVSIAETESELSITLEAGETVYLEQKMTMGVVTGDNRLAQLSEEEGREKLAKCALSAINREDPLTGERKRLPARLVSTSWNDDAFAELELTRVRESLQVKLPESLKPGQTYEFKLQLTYNTWRGNHAETRIVSADSSIVRVKSVPQTLPAGKLGLPDAAVFEVSSSDLVSLQKRREVPITLEDLPSGIEREMSIVFKPPSP